MQEAHIYSAVVVVIALVLQLRWCVKLHFQEARMLEHTTSSSGRFFFFFLIFSIYSLQNSSRRKLHFFFYFPRLPTDYKEAKSCHDRRELRKQASLLTWLVTFLVLVPLNWQSHVFLMAFSWFLYFIEKKIFEKKVIWKKNYLKKKIKIKRNNYNKIFKNYKN